MSANGSHESWQKSELFNNKKQTKVSLPFQIGIHFHPLLFAPLAGQTPRDYGQSNASRTANLGPIFGGFPSVNFSKKLSQTKLAETEIKTQS